MLNFPSLQDILLLLPAILIGLTVHEYAHGLAADRLGDHTARYQGRLTLNPLAHIDPVGFLMLLLFKFGWAKPVPVNPYNLRGDPSRGMLLVALAGPASNLLLAFLTAILLGTGLTKYNVYFHYIALYSLQINVVLAIFNLIPVPPLDGSKILAGLLPGQSRFIYGMETYGTIILLLLMFTGVFGRILWPLVSLIIKAFMAVATIL
ncbi:site-2 protease family protein [Desulfotruncus alcoholivorax]|uniref:site-2 protease family protein n=1 Tax=Desulfotruncus alcoholivorax TaxID=265477 RepID=UPI0004088D48|nr:site-2 protease family protein [Desulfotruncus alcoholivorax]